MPGPDGRKLASPLDVAGIPVKNISAYEIPAYGIMEQAGFAYLDGRIYMTVRRPTTDYKPVYLINGPQAMSDSSGDYPNGVGYYGITAPVWCLYDSSGPSASIGMVFGPTPNSFNGTAYRAGFHILGSGESTPFYRALVLQVPPDGIEVGLNEDLNYHDEAEADVMQWDPMGMEFSTTGQTVTVVDGGRIRSGYKLESGEKCSAVFRGGQWAVNVGPCDVPQ